MKIKPLTWGMCVSLAVIAAGSAFAQTGPAAPPADSAVPSDTRAGKPSRENVAACIYRPHEITSIRDPQLGMPNVWDMLYDGDGMEVFSDILPLDGPSYIAVGSYTKDPKDQIYHPLFVKFDDRLKPIWEHREESKEPKSITRILKSGEGFIALGETSPGGNGGIYVEFYDGKGKSKAIKTIFEAGGELDGKAIIPVADGTGYLIAAQYIGNADKSRQYGMLYKLSSGGNVLWKRSYQPGRSTVFQTIRQALNGTYMVAGQIVMDDNKSGGWLLNVDGEGRILWQQTYPRGTAAVLNSVIPMKDGNFILAGKIKPLGEMRQVSTMAAWIARASADGTILWERYFKSSNYDYEALDAIVYEDGRASVLVKGMGMDVYHRAHVRLMTMSPTGVIMSSEDYTEGQNAAARRLVSGLDGARIVAGYAQTSFGVDGKTEGPAPEYTYDGWLMAAPPLDTYNDPCAVPPAGNPILE